MIIPGYPSEHFKVQRILVIFPDYPAPVDLYTGIITLYERLAFDTPKLCYVQILQYPTQQCSLAHLESLRALVCTSKDYLNKYLSSSVPEKDADKIHRTFANDNFDGYIIYRGNPEDPEGYDTFINTYYNSLR